MKRMKKAFIFFLIFALLAGVLPKNALAQPVSENEKKPQEIHFAESVVSKKLGDPNFTIVIEEPPVGEWNGEVYYESSDAVVAEVERGSGEVTIKSFGTTVITATAPGDENDFYEGKASYTLEVGVIHAEVNGFDGPYDGKEHGISVIVTSPKNAVVGFDLDDEGSYSMTASPTYTDVSENGEAITVYYWINTDDGGYEPVSGSATVLISRAEISITAENKKSSYAGEDIQPLTYTVSGGYVSGDDLGITLTTDAKKGFPAGEYPINVSWNGNPNYTAELINGVYTIKKDPELTAPEAETGLIYNGSTQTLVKTETGKVTNGTLEYALSSDSSTAPASGWSTAVPAGTDAGTYYVWYRVIGDVGYNDIAAACVVVEMKGKSDTSETVKDAEQKDPELTAPEAETTLTYNGTVQSLVKAGEATGGTLQYALSSDSSTAPESGWSTAVPTATAAGTYNVWYRVIGGLEYKDIAAECISVVIAQAEITIAAEDKSGYEGDEIQKLTYRVTGSYVTGDELGVSVTTAAKEDSAAGNYPINVSWNGNANYKAKLQDGVYTIAKKGESESSGDPKKPEEGHKEEPESEKEIAEKKNPEVKQPPAAKESLVYSGTAQELVTAGEVNGGTLQYALSSDSSTAPESGWSTDVPIAAAAGTYNVWYRVKGDTGYKDIAPACIRSSIEKADITITAEDKSSYEGDEIQKLTYRVTGSYVTGDELGVNVMTAATKESAAGTYAISVSWNENTNYAAVLIDGVYTIVGTDFEVKPPAARENLVYTGEAQALVSPGLAANGILHYALGDKTGADTEYSTKLPFVTDAGTYYVWYKVKREAPEKDTEAACIIVSIGKAAPEITAEPEANQLVYTGTEQELVTAGTVKGGTYQYALGTGEYEEEIPSASAVGDYTVKYKVIGDKNHTDGDEKSVIVKITYSGASALPYINSETTELHLVKGQKFTLSETGWTVAKNKCVSISKKGALKAKKVTDSPVEITNGERIIKVYVTAPEMEKKISIEMGTSVKAPFKYDSEHLSVTWYSQSPETATVSDDGTIVGESKGKATVVAYIGGKAYNCKVTVGESTPALERTVYMTVGSKKTIKISKTKVSTWTVDDEDIAVANKKKITAKAVGETTVHGIDENDGKEYIIHLIVEDLSIISKGVNLTQKNKYKVTLAPGEALSIEFKSMIQPVFFKSNKSEIAYDNGTGTIVANKTGKAKLTAKINGKTITITVTVE